MRLISPKTRRRAERADTGRADTERADTERGDTARGDRGAVAVMVGVMASALIIVAALSVDLGNAWARARSVQKQADVSALAAGSLLPMSSTSGAGATKQAIAQRAALYLNSNRAVGQPAVTWQQLVNDSNLSNGHLEFQNADGSPCTDDCVQLRLTPPEAHVDFGLAAAVASGTDVTRSATVRLFSALPDPAKVIPLWLPSGCGYGPVDGDTTQGGGSSGKPTASPTPTPTATSTTTPTATSTPTASATQIPTTPVGTHTLSGPGAYNMAYGTTLDVKNLTITKVDDGTKKASVRAISPDGTYFVDYASADIKANVTTFKVADFTIGTEVSNTPGVWKLYAVIEKGNKDTYSANVVNLTVTGGPPPASTSTTPAPSASASASPTSIPVGCTGQDRGNFGQLFSPRVDTTNKNEALGRNLAVGLDHLPIPFDQVNYPIEKECAHSNGNNPWGKTL